MADNETTEDVIAWLRRPREGENAYLTAWRDEIADRLDAAHKRELAVYVLAIAKLRGALVKCRDIALLWQVDEAAGVAGTTDKPHARSAAEAVIDIEFEINAALFATATAEKLSAVGDAAKLREALKAIGGLCARLMPTWDGAIGRIKDIAEAALSAPPRNCDVGNAEEQTRRFMEFCIKHDECMKQAGKCPVFKKLGACKLEWAQMPYVEKEGGAK